MLFPQNSKNQTSENKNKLHLSPKTLWIRRQVANETLEVLDDFYRFWYYASQLSWKELQKDEIIAEIQFHIQPWKKTVVVDKFSTVNLNFWQEIENSYIQNALGDDCYLEIYLETYKANNVFKIPFEVKNERPWNPWYSIKWLGLFVFKDFVTDLKNKRIQYISLCSAMSAIPYYEKLFQTLENERVIRAFYVRPDTPWMFEVLL